MNPQPGQVRGLVFRNMLVNEVLKYKAESMNEISNETQLML